MTIEEYITKTLLSIADLKKNGRHVFYDLSVSFSSTSAEVNNLVHYFNNLEYGCEVRRCKKGQYDVSIWW